MNINELIKIIKKKIQTDIELENIEVEDKSFLHKNHTGNKKDRFHLKISIKSKTLKEMNKIEANKKIYKILKEEMNSYIHSLQILMR
jgi:BolA protein|tara:strand:+ start:374 stop:634 length:261 start_codon:yes stop_codon:yes gene_type:complete